MKSYVLRAITFYFYCCAHSTTTQKNIFSFYIVFFFLTFDFFSPKNSIFFSLRKNSEVKYTMRAKNIDSFSIVKRRKARALQKSRYNAIKHTLCARVGNITAGNIYVCWAKKNIIRTPHRYIAKRGEIEREKEIKRRKYNGTNTAVFLCYNFIKKKLDEN